MKFMLKTLVVGLGSAVSGWSLAEEPSAEHRVSGNISILSSYNLRGITNTPENKNATLQAGLNYQHASGVYAGWWGSTLDYGDNLPNAFENNLYLGINRAMNQDWGYTLGLTYYYYYDIDTSAANGVESLLGLTYQDFGLTVQTLLEDLTWGNAGDTYVKATYRQPLAQDFNLDTALGLYAYEKSDDLEGTTEHFGFRHFDIGLSKKFDKTGLSASMNYILGGYDRFDEKQKNKVVFTLGYSF